MYAGFKTSIAGQKGATVQALLGGHSTRDTGRTAAGSGQGKQIASSALGEASALHEKTLHPPGKLKVSCIDAKLQVYILVTFTH